MVNEMKRELELCLVSKDDDGKGLIRAAMESVHREIVLSKRQEKAIGSVADAFEAIRDASLGNRVEVAAESLLKEIYISQGVERDRVAMEGFGDLLLKLRKAITGKDEHGVKSTDRKPGSRINDHGEYSNEGKQAVKELREHLKKYYLNDHWLNGQKFVEGPVKAGDISKVFEIDGKVETDVLGSIDKAVKRVNDFSIKWEAVLKGVDKKVQEIDKRVKQETKGADEDDEDAVDKVKQAIKDFNAINDPLKQLPKFEGTSLGNLVPVVKNGELSVTAKTPSKGIAELPALNKEQVKAVAKVIDSIYSTGLIRDMGRIAWLDHSDGSDFNEWIYDADNDVYMDYYDLFYHQNAEVLWIYGVFDLIDTHALASALERWIDRSIV